MLSTDDCHQTVGRRSATLCALLLFAVGEPALAAAPAVTQYGDRSPRSPPELAAFAFLVGKWEGIGKTRLPDGKSAEFAVTWIGRYVLDGMAIADEFHSSSPDGSPYLGISLRQYRSDQKTWVVEYLNVSNSFLRRQVNGNTGSVTVNGQTVVVLSQAPEAWSRETYRITSPDRFTYSIDVSTDGGKAWTLGQMEISLSRKE